MGKFVGIILWWLFLTGATVLLENLIGAVPLWARVVVVVALGAAAIPLMFWRDIKSWRPKPSTKDGTVKLNAITPPQGLIADAYQTPGAGIHIAKLLLKVTDLDEANEIWDIFKDASSQTNKGSAYAAYVHALVKFDCSLAASETLREADQEWVPQAEMEAAMDRFYYPEEDDSDGRSSIH